MLAFVTFRAAPQARELLRKYYHQVLGMNLLQSTSSDNEDFFVYPASRRKQGRPTTSAGVHFQYDRKITSGYEGSRGDAYWKIGLALHDVNAEIDGLRKKDAAHAGAYRYANQFLDVGYLTHIQDPLGFAVELLQTTFEGNKSTRQQLLADAGQSLLNDGGRGIKIKSQLIQDPEVEPPVVGQITIRGSDPKETLAFYRDKLGMKLLCVEPVTEYGFDLYFLGFTEDVPPNAADLTAIENREWCYQRRYTTLEIQFPAQGQAGGRQSFSQPSENTAHMQRIMMVASSASSGQAGLSATCKLTEILARDAQKELVDPDGVRVIISASYPAGEADGPGEEEL